MQKARDKIEHAEKLIKELRKQQGYLEIRLEQEKREIKALKHELEVMHIARDLPVPKVRSLRGTGLRGGWRTNTCAPIQAGLLWCLTKHDRLAETS